MSKVVRIYRHGGPEELRFEDLAVGEPGPAQVRLKIEAIGLNRSEAAFRAGEYPVTPKFPTLIGYEGVGLIEAQGRMCKALPSASASVCCRTSVSASTESMASAPLSRRAAY